MPASSKKFRKILNDLKRRPEDAAKDLGVSRNKIKEILKKRNFSDLSLIEKAVKVWPVNYSDFFHTEDDTKNNIRFLNYPRPIN